MYYVVIYYLYTATPHVRRYAQTYRPDPELSQSSWVSIFSLQRIGIKLVNFPNIPDRLYLGPRIKHVCISDQTSLKLLKLIPANFVNLQKR